MVAIVPECAAKQAACCLALAATLRPCHHGTTCPLKSYHRPLSSFLLSNTDSRPAAEQGQTSSTSGSLRLQECDGHLQLAQHLATRTARPTCHTRLGVNQALKAGHAGDNVAWVQQDARDAVPRKINRQRLVHCGRWGVEEVAAPVGRGVAARDPAPLAAAAAGPTPMFRAALLAR